MIHGPYIRVDTVLLNVAAIAAITRHRNAADWATVTLLSGRTVDVHRPAGELITDISVLLREDGSR